jgi:hypothetical protein
MKKLDLDCRSAATYEPSDQDKTIYIPIHILNFLLNI